MGIRVYWEPGRKYDLKHADVWYKEVVHEMSVSEDNKIDILKNRKSFIRPNSIRLF